MRELILLLSVVMGLVSFGLIGKWYVVRALSGRVLGEALKPLLLLHTFRYVSLALLINGVTSVELDVRFIYPAAFGDLLAAVLAMVSLGALGGGWSLAVPLVWVFNVVGFLGLLITFVAGWRYAPVGHLGATYFIGAVLMPALGVSHGLMFRLLLRGSKG
jgi:hypothetical protein